MEVENFISKTGKMCARRNVVAEGGPSFFDLIPFDTNMQ